MVIYAAKGICIELQDIPNGLRQRKYDFGIGIGKQGIKRHAICTICTIGYIIASTYTG